MAMSQIRASKKPTTGANFRAPFMINITRMVAMDTSNILDRKISMGKSM
jgi:hypothetical protein